MTDNKETALNIDRDPDDVVSSDIIFDNILGETVQCSGAYFSMKSLQVQNVVVNITKRKN